MERMRLGKISEIVCCRTSAEVDAIAEEVNSHRNETTSLPCEYEVKYDVLHYGGDNERVDTVTVIMKDVEFGEEPEEQGRMYVTISRVLVFYVSRSLTEYVIDLFYGKSRTPSVPPDDRWVAECARMDLYVESIEFSEDEVICVLTDFWGFGEQTALAYIPDHTHPLELIRGMFAGELKVKWKMTTRRYRALQNVNLAPIMFGDMIAKVFEIRACDFIDNSGNRHAELYGIFDPIKVTEPYFTGH